MKRFVEGTDRGQATLFPEYLEDWIYQDNPVRAIDAFVDKLGLAELGFEGMVQTIETEGCPAEAPVMEEMTPCLSSRKPSSSFTR